MASRVTRPLRRVILHLQAQEERIEQQIKMVESTIKFLEGTDRETRAVSTGAKGKPYRMTAAGRRAISKRMKAYWAKRRAT